MLEGSTKTPVAAKVSERPVSSVTLTVHIREATTMKNLPLLLLAALAAAPVLGADVNVAVTIGDPRYYGRIDIVGYPQPQLLYPEPVLIQPAPASVAVQPIYVRVPPGHAKDWKKQCKKYKLCGQPVYFVQDTWYTQVYVPEYHAKKGKGDKAKHHKPKEKKD